MTFVIKVEVSEGSLQMQNFLLLDYLEKHCNQVKHFLIVKK